MKLLKKSLAICLVALLVVTGLLPGVAVKASALNNFDITIDFAEGYDPAQGHVEYQIDGGAWVSVSEDNTTIPVTEDVTNLLFKVVPAEYYEVNFGNGPHLTDGVGVAFEAGAEDPEMQAKRDLLIGDGYPATLTDGLGSVVLSNIAFRAGAGSERHANVSIDIDSTGQGLEYWNGDYPSRITFFIETPQGDENGGMIKWGGTDNLQWKGNYTIDGVFVKDADGVSTINPVEITYDYNGSGFVTIPVGISNASTQITSFKVNGDEFADQCPQTDDEFLSSLDAARSVTFEITNVPYNDTEYVIEIEAVFNDLMGGFGWNYLPEETQSGDDREDCIAHGTLSFIQGEYDGMVFDNAGAWNDYRYNGVAQIFEWHDGDKNYTDEHDAWGSAAFPRGAIITFKLIPDEGYQLTSLFGDKNLEPQEEPGVYKIEMTGGMNSHLMATFTPTEDAVKINNGAVANGEVSGLENPHGEGTMKLNLDEADINGESRDGFETKAEEEEVEIQEYIDINLANTIYKATEDPDEAWDRPVAELESPASIKLELSKDYEGKELVIIHEHDGQYEVIPVEFDGRNTISFETKSFSNYAIATKEPEEDPEKPEDPENPDEPGDPSDPPSGDEHYTLNDGDNSLEFDDRKDVDYSVVILDTNTITDEQLAAMGASRADMEAALNQIKSVVPKEFLDMYVVMIMNNETGEETWGRQNLVLKLKKTGAMEGYENFRLIDVSEIGEPSYTGEEIKGTEEDGYIVFKLKEVGNFALIADKAEDSSESSETPSSTPASTPSSTPEKKGDNPATGDENNLPLWIILLAITVATAAFVGKKVE